MSFSNIRTFCIIFFAFILSIPCRGQMDSILYCTDKPRIARSAVGELRLDVDAAIFLRDNEYENRLVKGYTLPGMWFNPSICYQPLKNLKVELGAYMIHFWGANNYPKANFANLEGIAARNTTKAFHYVPTFRANLQLMRNLNLVLGTLYGKGAHRLADPLYNEENNIVADPETGVQVLWNTSWVQLDTWVDWQSFIYKNDNRQERFAFGISTHFLPSRKQARAQWYFPLQIIMQHHGGEINSEARDRTIKTWMNACTGFGFRLPLSSNPDIAVGAELLGTYFSQQAGKALPFNKGWGIMGKTHAQIRNFGFTMGYMHSKDFISIYGNPLFGCVSSSYKGLTFDRPSVLWLRVEYARNLVKGFSWGIHADCFQQWQKGYDAPEQKLENVPKFSNNNFAIGIVFRMHPSFLLKKILLP